MLTPALCKISPQNLEFFIKLKSKCPTPLCVVSEFVQMRGASFFAHFCERGCTKDKERRRFKSKYMHIYLYIEAPLTLSRREKRAARLRTQHDQFV